MFVKLSIKIVLVLIHSPWFLSQMSHARRLFQLYLLRLLFIAQNGMTSLFSEHFMSQHFMVNAHATVVSFLVAGCYGGIMTYMISSTHMNWGF